MGIAVELLHGVAVLLALSLLQSLLTRLWPWNNVSRQIVSGLIFGGLCVAAMMMPIHIAPGIQIDARSVIISMSAVMGGPVVGVVTALIAVLFRAHLGGAGTYVGIGMITLALVSGLAYDYAHRRGWVRLGAPQFLVFGVVLNGITSLLVSLLLPVISLREYLVYTIPDIGIYGVATMLLGVLLLDSRRRDETERELQMSEERYRAAYEGIPIGIIETDETGTIHRFNHAAEVIYGYPAEEAIGQKMSMLIPQEDIEPYGDAENFIAKVVEPSMGRHVETTGMRRNGERFPIMVGNGTMKIGSTKSYITLVLDRTDMKAMEDKLLRAQRMEAIGQLTGGIAHDFNNILGIVLGNLEMLNETLKDDARAAPRVGAALRGAQRGADITRKLLSFTRKPEAGMRPLQINETVQEVQQLISRSLTVSVDLELRLGDDLLPVLADAGDLQDALLNLALNARDAMPDGGRILIETKSVSLKKRQIMEHGVLQPGNYVLIRFGDTGIGMSEEVRARALEPFFSSKDVSKGSGLGLSMVYGFVQRSGGQMDIRSEVGHGTEFNIYLPCAAAAAEQESAEDTQARTLPRGDEEALAEVAQVSLQGLGYQVVHAGNAKEAWQLLQARPDIDLLFTDVVLPGGLDGYGLAAEAWTLRPDLKVLVTSGYTRQTEESFAPSDERLTTLAHNILRKPYAQADLAAAVRQAIDGAAPPKSATASDAPAAS